MSLEFRKRRFRKPSKNGQLAIAIGAVLIGLAIAAAWIAISFRAQPSADTPSSDDTQSDTATFDAMSPSNLLVILTDEGHERFTLVQISPADRQVRVAAVPPTLSKDDTTLLNTMQKNGISDAVKFAADTLQLPIKHYIALNAEQAESWFNHLESGVMITLPQAVDFTDETGAIVRLDKGEHNLTATQTVALLRYDEWSDDTVSREFSAQVLAAMINQYATPQRRYISDFTTIANLSRTSLRYGDVNDYLPALEHTASAGNTLCVTNTLKGSYQTDRFIFDYQGTVTDSSLYTD